MALLNEHVGETGRRELLHVSVYVGELIKQPGDHAPPLMCLVTKRVFEKVISGSIFSSR